ncbi:MAG: hypothetical protein K2I19_07480 [Muribaculaceae bacterium]|nr:hypothetical protein [Muribaculaceae bacterium]
MKMKLKTILAIGALAVLPLTAAAQLPQGGPGIAVAGSVSPAELPQKAQEFLSKYYPQQQCASLMKEFTDNEYELRMTDGTEVTFFADGRIDEIEAPKGGILPLEVIKALLPEKSFRHLNDNGYLGMVNEIDYKSNGYKVSLKTNTPDDITYSLTGDVVEIDY